MEALRNQTGQHSIARPLRVGMQVKSVLILALIVIAVTSAGGWLYYQSVRTWARQRDRQDARRIARTLGLGAEQELPERRSARLQQLAEDFIRGGDVRYLAVLDREGQVVASASRGAAAKRWSESAALPVALRSLRQIDDNVLALAQPIVLHDDGAGDDKLIGAVRLVLDTSSTTSGLVKVRRRIWTIAAATVLCAIPLGYFLVWRLLVQPVRRLVRVVQRLGDQDFAARIGHRSSDEIGELELAFDTMAARITAMRDIMLGAKKRLERQVARRTAQLRVANGRLNEEMSQKEQLLEKLEVMAGTDPLTGLANRRHFSETLNRIYSQADRYEFDLTCCMCDLDGYKQLNDSLGHQFGDKILEIVADVIRQSIRGGDVAARYGGDEIVLLLPHTSVDRAFAVCERIRREIVAAMSALGKLEQPLTISIGMASLYGNRPGSADALVAMADKALYVAKERGKDQIATYAKSPGDMVLQE